MNSRCLTDFRFFVGMNGQEHDSYGSAFVESVVANDLRVGRHCMIGGFPCKIRELNRAAPGKHGHAKLRTVGQGIFDGKKREAIFVAQHVVPVPVIQKFQDVQCVTTQDGFRVETTEHDRLPSVLSFPGKDSTLDTPDEGTQVFLSVIVACGHCKITDVRSTTSAEVKMPSAGDQTFSEQPKVLSKKEERKQKRKMRKQAPSTVTPLSL